MAVINENFKIHALNHYKSLDLDRVFEDDYVLIATYPHTGKKIRFVLQNVTIDSDDEENLIFVDLDNATDAILPIDLMKGGQKVEKKDLLKIENAMVHQSEIKIKVSAISVGGYVLSSGDILEWADEEVADKPEQLEGGGRRVW